MQQAISLLLNYTILGLGVDDGEKCSPMPGGNTTWKAGETGCLHTHEEGFFLFFRRRALPVILDENSGHSGAMYRYFVRDHATWFLCSPSKLGRLSGATQPT